jgi:hypothetical protein
MLDFDINIGLVNCEVSGIKPTNRRQLLIQSWTEKGFSKELIDIASNTNFVRNMELIPVESK